MATRAAALAALALAGGCATGGKLQQRADVLSTDLDKARRSGALQCAPRDLALGETHVEFARADMGHGEATRAKRHLDQAEKSLKRALELSAACAPKQVTIAKRDAVVIERVDGDGDGVPDLEDRCPEVAGLPALSGCPDGDGDGLVDSADACPKDAGPVETQGCPVAKDTDADGTPDDIDRCPQDPEDKDGFQDEDGCPDADNDQDGIVDAMDACPVAAGPLDNKGCPDPDADADGFVDRKDACPDQPGIAPDGCPKRYSLVEVKAERIEIKQQVFFASAKYRVLPRSFALLDQVAQVLKDNPAMRISIEGHTDNVGGRQANVKLSQRRAEAVKAYLVRKGIDPARLEAKGFGPTKPIASNKTAKGKAKNRRTEFRIVARE
jgi:outer membrane protein OmpA-like peptidoglycan-associated protein